VVKTSAYCCYTDKQQLVERHTVLVKRIGYHLLARLPASVQIDDLIQSGMIGLLEAAKNFDATKGASFETFAGIRIRGAMLDEIRRGDWTPRSVHKNSRRVAQAIQAVENEQRRDATDNEVAEKLEISLNEYHHILHEVNSGKIIGIEDLGVSEDVIHNENSGYNDDPYQGIEDDAFNHSLAECIKTLPEREALVLSLYYDDELNLREIGEVLEVSESRVSQIHSQAMHRLKARLHQWQG
jgi:RNA polymerase sigma factor for flagellar operon FliA